MEPIEKYFISLLNLKQKIHKLELTHPNESRFKELFKELKPKNRKRKAKKVSPKNIMMDDDQRTSIIIKNIPDYLSSLDLLSILFKLGIKMNFFYIPYNVITRKKLRVAFLNVNNCKEIVLIYMGLIHKKVFHYEDSNIHTEICYSTVQGKEKLVQRFFGSSRKYLLEKDFFL